MNFRVFRDFVLSLENFNDKNYLEKILPRKKNTNRRAEKSTSTAPNSMTDEGKRGLSAASNSGYAARGECCQRKNQNMEGDRQGRNRYKADCRLFQFSLSQNHRRFQKDF